MSSPLCKARRKAACPRVASGVLVGVVVGLVVAASAGFAASRLLAPPEQPMQTAEVTQGTFEETVSGKGTLEPVRTTIASPEVEGIVESVNVGEGAAVNEGDVLYTLKNDDLDLAVAQANAQLQSARDALTQANNKLKLARTTPSFSEGQDAQGNPVIVNTQPSQISDAESQVNSAKSALDSAQSTYGRRRGEGREAHRPREHGGPRCWPATSLREPP